MIDLHSEAQSLTIQLPADLISELHQLAQQSNLSIDDVVREACLAYAEPYIWERCYQEWQRNHPDQASADFGIDGDTLAPPATEKSPP
jgi:predicted transcriptional regulator